MKIQKFNENTTENTTVNFEMFIFNDDENDIHVNPTFEQFKTMSYFFDLYIKDKFNFDITKEEISEFEDDVKDIYKEYGFDDKDKSIEVNYDDYNLYVGDCLIFYNRNLPHSEQIRVDKINEILSSVEINITLGNYTINGDINEAIFSAYSSLENLEKEYKYHKDFKKYNI